MPNILSCDTGSTDGLLPFPIPLPFLYLWRNVVTFRPIPRFHEIKDSTVICNVIKVLVDLGCSRFLRTVKLLVVPDFCVGCQKVFEDGEPDSLGIHDGHQCSQDGKLWSREPGLLVCYHKRLTGQFVAPGLEVGSHRFGADSYGETVGTRHGGKPVPVHCAVRVH